MSRSRPRLRWLVVLVLAGVACFASLLARLLLCCVGLRWVVVAARVCLRVAVCCLLCSCCEHLRSCAQTRDVRETPWHQSGNYLQDN